MNSEVWVLGGTGRSGRAIAAELLGRDLQPVLVGRDSTRLAEAGAELGVERTRAMASLEEMAAEIEHQRPAVVINTIGSFTSTSVPLARACLPGSHYLDLANDIGAVLAVLSLCAGRPRPSAVRVDMVPSLETDEGVIGTA